jgi:hypothetical protein
MPPGTVERYGRRPGEEDRVQGDGRFSTEEVKDRIGQCPDRSRPGVKAWLRQRRYRLAILRYPLWAYPTRVPSAS